MLLFNVPWAPQFPSVGEGAYGYVLDFATRHHLIYGREIIYTLGPFSPFFHTYYSHGAYVATLLIRLLTLLVFCGALLELFGSLPVLFFVPLLVAAFYAQRLSSDNYLFSASLLLVIYAVKTDTPRRIWWMFLLSQVAAVGTLHKGTAAFMSIALVIVADAYILVALRKIPFNFLTYFLAVCLLQVVVGQPLTALPDLAWTYLEFSRSFGEAMQWPGPVIELYAYLFIQTGLLAVFLLRYRPQNIWAKGALVSGFLVYAFFFWKAGFVRHDVHAFQAYAAALIGASLIAGLLLIGMANEPGLKTGVQRAAIVSEVIGVIFIAGLGVNRLHDNFFDLDLAGTFLREPANAVVKFAGFWRRGYFDRLAARLVETESQIARQFPVPALDKSVDILGAEQPVLLANHLVYQPRPVFQSYAAYSAALLGKNIQFFRSERAPEYLLFRFPNGWGMEYVFFHEAAIWPVLLERYDLYGYQAPYFVLRRRMVDRQPIRSELGRSSVRFGDQVEVPRTEGIIVATVMIHRSLLGRIAQALYKVTWPELVVYTSDGKSHLSRLVTDMSRVEFIVSKLFQGSSDVAGLFLGHAKADVLRMEILYPPGWEKIFYKPTVEIIFRSLVFPEPITWAPSRLPHSGLENLKYWLELRDHSDLKNARQQIVIHDPDERGSPRYALAHAPSKSYLIPPRAEQVRVRFGIIDEAWQHGGPIRGVNFRITAIDARKGAKVLWDRKQHPVAIETDRGEQEAVISLPAGVERLVFETLDNGDAHWAWSYWSSIEFPFAAGESPPGG